jgi:hypothetical protein
MAGEQYEPLRSFCSRHKAWHCVLDVSYHVPMPSVLLCFVQEVAQTVMQRSLQTRGDEGCQLLAANAVCFLRDQAMLILPLDLVPYTRPVFILAHIRVLKCMCLTRSQPEPRPLATPSQDLSRCREQRYFSQAVLNYLAVLLVCGAFSLNQ